MVVASAAQAASTGALLLAEKDFADPGELSASERERWRSATKRRTWGEIAPAIGWTQGESTHLVALATAPVAFTGPVVAQMGRGQLSWRLARALWRACQDLAAADAAHVAHVMCADEADSCVPERLEPDGSVTAAPWGHRAFWTALDREVAKLTLADDSPDAEADRAAREAAFAARCVIAKGGEDGMGSLTILMPLFWVGVVKDRLVGGADAARAAGDERTQHQLQADIARALLAHAALGVGDLPVPDVPAGQELSAGDLAQAGWSPELIAALSHLPPTVLQVIVPLIGLHDPATADTLPTTGRTSSRPDPNTSRHHGEDTWEDGQDAPGQDDRDDAEESSYHATGPGPGHSGRDGCPACRPSRRTHRPVDDRRAEETAFSCGGDCARGAGCAPGDDRARVEDCVHGDCPGQGEDCARGKDCDYGGRSGYGECRAASEGRGCGEDCARRGRRLWVGQMMGSFGSFVSPAQVRELALSPGTTMARLLVDPADGRCVERSRTTYLMDAAMRAQILAADVTCRAPGCHHTGGRCQVDHVQEYSAGGATSEANGQLLHTGHHEPKTAKAWDAYLAANRDVTWTSLLGRIYRTRAWDYRRYVTVLTEAIEHVASAPAQDFADVLNHEVYLALTFRDLGERLNPGDDEVELDITRFGGWGLIGLTHTERETGQRVPGPAPWAVATAYARWATAAPPDPGPESTAPDGTGPDDAGPDGVDDAGPGPCGAGVHDATSTKAEPAKAGPGREARPDPGHPGDRAERVGGADAGGQGLMRAPAQPRVVGPYRGDQIVPPTGWTRRDWAAHIRRRIANGENCPPF